MRHLYYNINNIEVRRTKTNMKVDGKTRPTSYTYDRNGNMTWDANRGVHMQWDVNNRLSCAYYNPGVLSFTRSATGRRLSRSYSPNQSVALVGGTIKKGRSLGDFPSFGGFDRPGQTGFPIIDTYDTYGSYEYENGAFSRLNTTTGYHDSLGVHVYVRDWQGNIRAVVRRNAQGVVELEQATYYYPYGMPMAESTNPTANRYKYTGKELLSDHGVNIMDYGARFYDPVTGIWLSPDPHSADYAPISHYIMCAGDPINYIDPDGRDYFLFDQKGNLMEQVKFDDFDMVAMKMGDDEYKIGPIFEAGTISVLVTIDDIDSETGESLKINIFNVNGDANGKDLHEFLSDNGTVEFSRFSTDERSGGESSNYLSTSHQTNRENGAWHVANMLHKNNVNVRSYIHNHPSRTITLLGSDIETRNYFKSSSKSFQDTSFKIYIKPTQDQYRSYYDYTKRILPGIMLNRALPSIL